ncbi:MAG: amino acid ABC transporter substrate-binding protein, partial [Mesorhizobium sp.]
MTLRNAVKSTIAAMLMLGAAGLATQAKADAVDDITKAGAINVGIFSDFPPFSSASADMSIKGYDID